MNHRRKMIVLLTLCSLIIVFVSWNDDNGRNLKVLSKDISGDSLQMVMDEFTEALNVSCAFCHAAKGGDSKSLDYASDANKHKEITRTMMRMTINMNKEYMETLPHKNIQLVTCNTCHRGKSTPEVK
jgi:hypothetical protein